jgi:hypothetical protein
LKAGFGEREKWQNVMTEKLLWLYLNNRHQRWRKIAFVLPSIHISFISIFLPFPIQIPSHTRPIKTFWECQICITNISDCLEKCKWILSSIDYGGWIDSVRFSCCSRHFSGSTLWIPWPTELITSECISQNEGLRSIVFETGSRLEQIATKVFLKTDLKFVTILRLLEVWGQYCFSGCKSLSLVTFESGSRLPRIEYDTFIRIGLVEIIIPESDEVWGEYCFSDRRSLSSVPFEPRSRLSRIKAAVFYPSGFVEMIILSMVEILGRLCFCNCKSLSPFHLNQGQDWHELKRTDLRRVDWLRLWFLHELKSCMRNTFLSADYFPLFSRGGEKYRMFRADVSTSPECE